MPDRVTVVDRVLVIVDDLIDWQNNKMQRMGGRLGVRELLLGMTLIGPGVGKGV